MGDDVRILRDRLAQMGAQVGIGFKLDCECAPRRSIASPPDAAILPVAAQLFCQHFSKMFIWFRVGDELEVEVGWRYVKTDQFGLPVQSEHPSTRTSLELS